MNQTKELELDWVLDGAAVEELLAAMGFRSEIVEFFAEAARAVAQSHEVPRFLELCSKWQENPNQYSGEVYASSWKGLAAISAFPQALQQHHALGVSEAISHATLRDLQRHIEYSAENDSWHFDKLNWISKHLGGEFFEIGRLQYHLGSFEYKARVYRDSETHEVVTLALGGRQCTPEGWPVDDADGFVTYFEERSDGVYGHSISPIDGSIAPDVTRVPPHSEVLLSSQYPIAHVHIPSGEKLDPAACRASLQDAVEFFEQKFPQVTLRGFVTSTWLLDRTLAKVLPSNSNIVVFGSLFRPLPLTNGNDRQLLSRVFNRAQSWEECRAETSLQKAILEHHCKGESFRMTAGYILMEDVQTYPLSGW